jgi:glutathione synthase/RimK-type ligase-like ATP-grasp enzyme
MNKLKKYKLFRPLVLSRHPSHSILRAKNQTLPLLPFRSVIRLGSSTESDGRLEINTVEAVKNSASKLLMKQKFTEVGVKTAEWRKGSLLTLPYTTNEYIAFMSEDVDGYNQINYPIVAKSHFGSRGIGNTKFNTREELEAWLPGKNLNNYIFEEFVKMTREYRLHVTKFGCFYTCRKLVKNDAPEDTWQKHDDVCNWILEENPSFKKPKNWEAIVADCIKAKDALGLDICAFDVGVQGAKDGVERENPEWVIFESCSAPSFGNITSQKYIEILPKLLIDKYNNK